MTVGNHTYTVEASQPYVQTDIPTHFASAPTQSNNSGITSTGSFVVLSNSQKQADTNVAVDTTEKEIIIIANDETNISVPSNVTDATINIDVLTTDNGTNTTATLPEINISAITSISTNPVTVAIPTGTVVSAVTG
jgi:hypothetical protein